MHLSGVNSHFDNFRLLILQNNLTGIVVILSIRNEIDIWSLIFIFLFFCFFKKKYGQFAVKFQHVVCAFGKYQQKFMGFLCFLYLCPMYTIIHTRWEYYFSQWEYVFISPYIFIYIYKKWRLVLLALLLSIHYSIYYFP